MRFKDYLAEGNSKFDIEQFKKDCAFFFDQLDKEESHRAIPVFKHGSKNATSDWDIQQFRERDAPRDSPMALHNAVNEFYKKKFGFPFRNALFASGHWSSAANYGPVNYIFPIGKFEWLCNPEIEDLTGEFETAVDQIKHFHPEMLYDERVEAATEKVITTLEKSKKFYHNKDLWSCADFGSEVMIKCEKFYRFSEHGDAWKEVTAWFEDMANENARKRWEDVHGTRPWEDSK